MLIVNELIKASESRPVRGYYCAQFTRFHPRLRMSYVFVRGWPRADPFGPDCHDALLDTASVIWHAGDGRVFPGLEGGMRSVDKIQKILCGPGFGPAGCGFETIQDEAISQRWRLDKLANGFRRGRHVRHGHDQGVFAVTRIVANPSAIGQHTGGPARHGLDARAPESVVAG